MSTAVRFIITAKTFKILKSLTVSMQSAPDKTFSIVHTLHGSISVYWSFVWKDTWKALQLVFATEISPEMLKRPEGSPKHFSL